MTSNSKEYTSNVRVYHWTPFIATILFVSLFLVTFWIGTSYVFASVTAGVPAIVLLWFWSRAARNLDKQTCATCGHSLSGGLPWSYPPTKCPACGAPLEKKSLERC